MGHFLQTMCRKCGYSTTLQVGPGEGVTLEPRACNECRVLVDVPVWFNLNLRNEQAGDLGRCPKCKGQNLTSWVPERSCPRCGAGPMEEKEGYGIWD